MLWNTMLEELPLSSAERAGMSAAELSQALPFPSIDRPALGGWWEGAGAERRLRGQVGAAECRLCAIRDYVDACRAEVAANPWPYLNLPHPGANSPARGDHTGSGQSRVVAVLRDMAAAKL